MSCFVLPCGVASPNLRITHISKKLLQCGRFFLLLAHGGAWRVARRCRAWFGGVSAPLNCGWRLFSPHYAPRSGSLCPVPLFPLAFSRFLAPSRSSVLFKFVTSGWLGRTMFQIWRPDWRQRLRGQRLSASACKVGGREGIRQTSI